MNAKKVVNFLLLRPVFTKKNFSSIGLVGIFVLLYILFGGKIDLNIPKLESGGSFGSVGNTNPDLINRSPQDILGYKESTDRAQRIAEMNKFGRSDILEKSDNSPYVKKELLDIQNNKYVFDRQESEIREVENERKKDKFYQIEDRLKNIRE